MGCVYTSFDGNISQGISHDNKNDKTGFLANYPN